MTERPSPAGTLAAAWGTAGVVLLLGTAVTRLGQRALSTLLDGLTPVQWGALVALTGLFVYGEGLLALQRRWVPSVMRRLDGLRRQPTWLRSVLAPLHGLALVGVGPRTAARAWAGVAAVAVAVTAVGALPAPWRGITDFAVAAALAWGLGAVLRSALQLFATPSRLLGSVENS